MITPIKIQITQIKTKSIYLCNRFKKSVQSGCQLYFGKTVEIPPFGPFLNKELVKSIL